MKVIMLSIDKRVLEEGSRAQKQVIEYAGLVDRLEIVLNTHTWRDGKLKARDIASNCRVYPTNLRHRIFYPLKLISIVRRIIMTGARECWLVTAQEAMTAVNAAVFLKTLFRLPLQVQVHEDFLSPHFGGGFRRFLQRLGYRMALSRADGIRVVSLRIRDTLVAKFKIPRTKITVLPIWVDAEAYRSPGIDTTCNLHKLYPQFENIILMVGRLEPEKNIGMAVAAMVDIVSTYPKTGLIIVGEGSELGRLKSLVAERKLGGSVVFENWKDSTALVGYYKSCDVFLLTSNFEGYGMVLVEAAASGAAIVSTDVGLVGGEEVNNKNAIVVPVGDRTAISAALKTLIQNPEMRLMMGNRTKNSVKGVSGNDYLHYYKRAWLDCVRQGA